MARDHDSPDILGRTSHLSSRALSQSGPTSCSSRPGVSASELSGLSSADPSKAGMILDSSSNEPTFAKADPTSPADTVSTASARLPNPTSRGMSRNAAWRSSSNPSSLFSLLFERFNDSPARPEQPRVLADGVLRLESTLHSFKVGGGLRAVATRPRSRTACAWQPYPAAPSDRLRGPPRPEPSRQSVQPADESACASSR